MVFGTIEEGSSPSGSTRKKTTKHMFCRFFYNRLRFSSYLNFISLIFFFVGLWRLIARLFPATLKSPPNGKTCFFYFLYFFI